MCKETEDFLCEILTEITNLQENGISYREEVFEVKINAFICDAPVREFLKCIKGHNAYYSCERCIIKGKWNGRVVFDIEDEIEPLRPEEMFNEFGCQSHQIKRTPLISSGLYCIKSFPLDYMHLICLCVVKRLLIFETGPKRMQIIKSAV